MKTPASEKTSFKWLLGALVLGIVLGACFTILLRAPSSSAPLFAAEAVSPKVDRALSEGLERAKRLADQGKAPEAVELLESLIVRFPKAPEPYNNLAAVLALQGELEAGRELLEKALRTHEGYSAAYDNLGIIFSEIARTSYGKALRLDIPPSTPDLKVVTAARPAPASVASDILRDEPESAPPREEPAKEVRTAAAPPAAAQRPEPPPAQPAAPPAPAQAPAAPSAPAPAAAAPQAAPTAPANDQREAVLQTLREWAAAWSARDVPLYLSYYSEHFRPDDGMDRAAWEELRHQRIRHPSRIRVTLSDIQLSWTGPDSVQVTMVQDYDADTYKGRSRKAMNLVKEGGAWRILTENSLGTAR